MKRITQPLSESHPHLLLEWDYEKNQLDPTVITRSSTEEVYWVCQEHHHSWKTKVKNRSTSRSGCPYCAHKKILAGFNDLATTAPELLTSWHPTKNTEVSPQTIFKSHRHKVWWKGSCGHEWEASPLSRSLGNGCPICYKPMTITGVNDLATVNPTLAAQWHPTKNGALTPNEIPKSYRHKVWWKGPCGHEWQATPQSRSIGNGCPICSQRLIVPGLNDLATINPELARQWHPTRNKDLRPSQVAPSSHLNVWWKCPTCQNEWQATVSNRRTGTGCMECYLDKRFRRKQA